MFQCYGAHSVMYLVKYIMFLLRDVNYNGNEIYCNSEDGSRN